MNEYTKQADDFLQATGTTFKIEYLRTGPYFADDKESRDIYQFTLKNERGEYSATFGNSLQATQDRANAAKYRGFSKYPPNPKEEAKIKASITRHKAAPMPTAYDILVGLGHYTDPVFENWAADCGYDDAPMKDYVTIRAIHDACLKEQQAMERLFTAEEREVLQEIN